MASLLQRSMSDTRQSNVACAQHAPVLNVRMHVKVPAQAQTGVHVCEVIRLHLARSTLPIATHRTVDALDDNEKQ